MGKKDRIKRSPSHSNAKIPLSIKELQEFVAATSKDDGKELVEDSAEGSLEEVQARARARAFGAIIESCENKNISSILCLIRDLPVVPRPFNAETQARYDEVQRRFDAMSNSELEATNSALRQTQQAAKALIEDATSNAIGIVLTDESVDDSIEVDQEIKLSIKELKEFVDVTSSSVGTNLNEGSAEGSLDEDIVEKFSDFQDSCELVRARRVRDADADLANPIDAAVQDPMGTDLTHNPSNPSWFTEMQARMLAIKSSSDLSTSKNNAASHFETFLTEVMQTEKNGGHNSSSTSGPLNCVVRAPEMDAHVQAIQSPVHTDSGLLLDFDPYSAGLEFPKVFCGPSNGNINHRNVGYAQAGFAAKPSQTIDPGHMYSCNAQIPDPGGVDTQQVGPKHDITGHYCVGPSTINTQVNPDKPSACVIPFGQDLEPLGHVSASTTTYSKHHMGLEDQLGPTDLMVGRHHHFAEKNNIILMRHSDDGLKFHSALNAQDLIINTQDRVQMDGPTPVRRINKGPLIVPDSEITQGSKLIVSQSLAHTQPEHLMQSWNSQHPVVPCGCGKEDHVSCQDFDNNIMAKVHYGPRGLGPTETQVTDLKPLPDIEGMNHSGLISSVGHELGLTKNNPAQMSAISSFAPCVVGSSTARNGESPRFNQNDSKVSDLYIGVGPGQSGFSDPSHACGLSVGLPVGSVPSKFSKPNGFEPTNVAKASDSGLCATQTFSSVLENCGQPTKEDSVKSTHGAWSGLFQTPAQELHLSHIELGICRQERKLIVPSDIVETGSREWQNTLVGFFLDRKLPYSLVVKATSKFWGNAGLLDTLATDHGTFFFKFDSSSSLAAVRDGGPWYVAGKPLILRQWEPHMAIEKDRISRIPVWVHFYNIPLEYWNQGGLSYIASMVGKPLHVDKMTASRRRITYARVCIEVDAANEWITSFDLASADNKSLITIQVEYQWTPSRCSICKCFGHDCYRKDQKMNTSQQWVPVRKHPPESILPVNLPPMGPSFGAPEEDKWFEVKRKGKSKVGTSTEVHNDPRLTKIQGTLTSTSPDIQVSNSFDGLIPYVYDTTMAVHDDESQDALRGEESIEDDRTGKEVADDDLLTPVGSTLSSRQRKKEAKRLFSASRPKGRHRSG